MAEESIMDIASKMLSMKGTVETSRQREEASQRAQMKFMLDQQRAKSKAELDNMKYMTSKYTDLYFKAKGNTALQENILSTMQGMKQSMPPVFRQQFDVITKAGPFSEVAEKGRKFTELYGDGPRPLTKEEGEDSMVKGKHAFAVLDYTQKREHFLTGKSPGKKRRFVSIGDGNVLGRTDDGFLYQTTEESLGIQALAKDNGVNPGKLFADDGLVFGTARNGNIGGRSVTVTPYKDLLGNEKPGQDVSYGKTGKAGRRWESAALRSFVINFMSDSKGVSEGAKTARNIKALINETGIRPRKSFVPSKKPSRARLKELAELDNKVTAALRRIPEFRNLNFRIVDSKYDPESLFEDIWGVWGVSDTAGVMAFPGKPEQVMTLDGRMPTLYRHENDAYDSMGQLLGDWDKTVQMFNATTAADLSK
jgi:hypothetical protein